MLEIKQLDTGFGRKQVLFGLSMEVMSGQIVALIGPNGAGKSTILKAVCGIIPAWNGTICFNGTMITNSSPSQNVARGITFAPQGNRVFPELTVLENLEIGGIHLPRKETDQRIGQVIELLPTLKPHLRKYANQLSGGEQQILSVARALIAKPKLLMLDEPSLGLSPDIVKIIFRKVFDLNRELGIGVLIVEQKVKEVLEISDRVYAIKLGQVAYSGDPAELKENINLLKNLFL